MNKYRDVRWKVARHPTLVGEEGPERVYFFHERQDPSFPCPVKVIVHPTTDFELASRIALALNLVIGYSVAELEQMATLPPPLQPIAPQPTITLPKMKQLRVRARRPR